MLTEIYIEALLVDEELADQVWQAWDAGEIDDQTVCIAGCCLLVLGIEATRIVWINANVFLGTAQRVAF